MGEGAFTTANGLPKISGNANMPESAEILNLQLADKYTSAKSL